MGRSYPRRSPLAYAFTVRITRGGALARRPTCDANAAPGARSAARRADVPPACRNSMRAALGQLPPTVTGDRGWRKRAATERREPQCHEIPSEGSAAPSSLATRNGAATGGAAATACKHSLQAAIKCGTKRAPRPVTRWRSSRSPIPRGTSPMVQSPTTGCQPSKSGSGASACAIVAISP